MKTETRKNYKFKIYLGTLKGAHPEPIYLNGFEWSCGWYWGGGYIGNRNMHCHFNGCFLECPDSRGHSLGNFYDPWTKLPDYLKEEDVQRISNGAAVWEDLDFFLNNAQYNTGQWWRIKDLYKQFYIYHNAAEAFQYGGHCSTSGRTKQEINMRKAKSIDDHIEFVIIPEIIEALGYKINEDGDVISKEIEKVV